MMWATLPTALAGAGHRGRGANTLQIFQQPDAIDGGAVDASMTLDPGLKIVFESIDAVNWTSAGRWQVVSGLTPNMAVVADGAGDLVSSGTVSATELSYLDGVTSNIQAQLDAGASTAPRCAPFMYGAVMIAMTGHAW